MLWPVNRRSPAVITLIYCFIAVRSLLAVDGLQLAACAQLMQIKKKKKHHIPHLHCSEFSELIWELQSCTVMSCVGCALDTEAQSHFTLTGPSPSREDSPQIVVHRTENLTFGQETVWWDHTKMLFPITVYFIISFVLWAYQALIIGLTDDALSRSLFKCIHMSELSFLIYLLWLWPPVCGKHEWPHAEGLCLLGMQSRCLRFVCTLIVH